MGGFTVLATCADGDNGVFSFADKAVTFDNNLSCPSSIEVLSRALGGPVRSLTILAVVFALVAEEEEVAFEVCDVKLLDFLPFVAELSGREFLDIVSVRFFDFFF